MPISSAFKLENGQPNRFGPIILGSEVNFCLYSPNAKSVRLILFEYKKSQKIAEQIADISLDPIQNRTGHAWHIQVDNLPKFVLYAYRIDGGPLITDPYSPELWSGNAWGQPNHTHSGQSRYYSPLSLVNRSTTFDWENIQSPHLSLRDLIIYELHIKGFTYDPSSHVDHPGTYLGFIQKIPYLKELGFNAIELLPIQEFNELTKCESSVLTKQKLLNYWGYSPTSFFAPMNRFASSGNPGAAAEELKLMVRECHRHGIEVILDVVFNHTDIQSHPTRFLDRNTYYLLDSENHDLNFSGCGNTFNCNHPLSIDLILSALRNWVSEFHVDGFRFDLASIMTRDTDGSPMENPPLIRAINADPILADTKLIAEPWDAAGLYHVGNFPAHEGRWAEWNGKFRDDVRKFIKGTEFTKGAFATRFCGSEDLYHAGRKPYHSINMITCHDGFSLNDLVSYQEKHNEGNAENNHDGTNCHDSWNCGAEGETDDIEIQNLRNHQIKNFMTALFLSQGVPLWRMGDEIRHTQKGNNNAWCQDNELSWFNWDKIETSHPLLQFLKTLISLRKENKLFRQAHFLSPQDIEWHGNWEEDDRIIALTLKDHENEEDFYIAFNASHLKKEIILPTPPQNRRWCTLVDSTQDSPNETLSEPLIIQPYSAIVLNAQPTL
ncbi:MAG: hypothetical protein K940chlam3_01073 [Chlamydiae bacterium]|nr:hypothetical protein [Chlamydiota bacterium]